MLNFLVTGAAGVVGRHLVSTLLGEGHAVVGVDNFRTARRDDLVRLQGEGRFEFAEVDVVSETFKSFADARRFDAIYHLACPTGVPNLEPLALEMLEASYEGSKAVL